MRWLDLEAEEKALPCPFCGGKVSADFLPDEDRFKHRMVCECGYSSAQQESLPEAVEIHNRVAKIVMESEVTK